MKKIHIQKTFVLKLCVFCFEIPVFPNGCVISFILYLLQLLCDMAQFYFTDAHLEFLEGRSLKLSKKRANLYQEYTFIGKQLLRIVED